ncbi:MAG: hypothetical protein REH83_04725 [Rickettsiella sp.]|nr:hypothetical protein [Rickettsiella sp.]
MKSLNKKLVKTAYAQEWAFRNATQKELLQFKKKLWKHIKKSQFTPAEIKEKLLEKLQQDRKLIDALNLELKNSPSEATYPLRYNKMLDILNDTILFINDNFDSFFESIKNNRELENYHIKTAKNDVTTMDNTGPSIYGTSKGSILKTVLLNAELIYSGKTHLSDIKPDENLLNKFISFLKKCFGSKSQFWIDKTPNAQVTPLPQTLDPQSIKIEGSDFTECTYFYKDAKTEKGLAYTHSGYAFDGYRNDPRYPYPPGKLFGPEDCSSWIGKTTLGVDEVSTSDLWNRWKYEYPQQGFSVPEGWVNTATAQSLIKRYTPLKISEPQTDIVPGLVWAMHEFDTKEDPEMKGNGKGGHTVLIVKEGIDESNKVKGIGYNRDMPKIEGFGVSSFPSIDQPTKRIMFFKVNPKTKEPPRIINTPTSESTPLLLAF